MEIRILILFVLILLDVPLTYIGLYLIYFIYYLIIKYEINIETYDKMYNKDNIVQNKLPYVKKEFTEEQIKKYIDENQETNMRTLFYQDIFRPPEDYFSKKNPYRQFVKVPDMEGYKNFIIGEMKSCKEDY
jgi:diphthamide biosynthesis methyltransferase